MDTFGDITTSGPDEGTTARTARHRIGPIPLAVLGAVVVCASVAVFQRVGTIANANVVETTQNLAGGFLAVGMTEEQPGFILVSALEEKDVKLDAELSSTKLTGTHTNVFIDSGAQTLKARLRKPLVITIDGDGAIQSCSVDWPLHTFHLITDAVDCSHQASLKRKRCGEPFHDLKERFAKWPPGTVPQCLRDFLASR